MYCEWSSWYLRRQPRTSLPEPDYNSDLLLKNNNAFHAAYWDFSVQQRFEYEKQVFCKYWFIVIYVQLNLGASRRCCRYQTSVRESCEKVYFWQHPPTTMANIFNDDLERNQPLFTWVQLQETKATLPTGNSYMSWFSSVPLKVITGATAVPPMVYMALRVELDKSGISADRIKHTLQNQE
jgi:hypothetical protein